MPRPKALFTAALLFSSVPALAQRGYDGSHDYNRGSDRASQRDYRDHGSANRGDRQYRDRQDFYRGVREGGRGGQYYDSRHAHDGYDDRFNQRRGGIGPGKGAAIGAAGGAILGAVLGGGLKGSLIGGAAGAGIGAIVGEAAQNHRRDSHERREARPRP